MNSLKALAQALMEKEISLILLPFGEKKPIKPWKEYQSRRADQDELFKDAPGKFNLGIVTGSISRLAVVDLDDSDAIKWAQTNLPVTPMKTQTSKGEHWFYSLKEGQAVGNKVKLQHAGSALNIDIRGDGGYVLSPESTHPNGHIYKATEDWDNIKISDLPTFPGEFFSQIPAQDNTPNTPSLTLNPAIQKKLNELGQAIEGRGGDDLTYRACCLLVRDLGLPVHQAFEYLADWNQYNSPPWIEAELNAKLMNASEYGKGPVSKKHKLTLTPIQELLNEPAEEITWLWDQRLTACGTSLLVSKPKTGKTTLARGLGVAIATGQSFLGWPTNKGPVFYIAAEENREQFKKSLSSLNSEGLTDLYIHTGPVPPDVIAEIDAYAEKIKPSLIIVDTLIRVLSVKDTNDYAEVSKAMTPLQEIAVKNKCHVLLIHHAGKIDRDHGDSVLGSTALSASVDTLIFLDRKENKNQIRTIQRYGEWLEPHLLEFCSETKEISIGGSSFEAKRASTEQEILSFVSENANCLQKEIYGNVIGHKKHISITLQNLVAKGLVQRSGSGHKGDAFQYQVPPY